MARTKHRPTRAESLLVEALEGAREALGEVREERDELLRRARRAGATWAVLTEASGLSKETVRKIVNRVVDTPGRE